MKKQTIVARLKPTRFQIWKQIILLALLVFITFLLVIGYAGTRLSALDQFHTAQITFSDQLAREIQSRFGHLDTVLNLMRTSSDIVELNRRGMESMEWMLDSHSDLVSAVTRVDETGTITSTFPEVEGAAGSDISGQDHIRELLETREPVLSDAFQTVQGYWALAYHMPVIDKSGEFRGSIAVAIPFTVMMDSLVGEMATGMGSHIWIVGGDDHVLYSLMPEQEGTLFRGVSASPGFFAMASAVSAGETGHTLSSFDLNDSGREVDYLATFLSFDVLGERWSAIMVMPESEILRNISALRNTFLLGALAFLALSLLYFALKIRAWISSTQEKKWSDVARTHELLRLTIDQANELIILLDNGQHILYANPAVEQVTGFGKGMVGKRLLDLPFTSLSPEPAEIAEQVKSSGRWMGTVEGEGVKGCLFKLSLSISSSADPYGAGDFFILIARDVTVQSEMERRLYEQQKMEAIGQLAGGIAHDFNNLLVGIQGYAELLERRYGDDPEIVRSAGVILAAVFRGSELTRQLLGYARKGKHKIEPVDLSGCIRNVCSLLGRTMDRSIAIELDLEDGITVTGDPSQLEQVILNLAVNSQQAMPDGGTLRFSLRKALLPGAVLKGDDGSTPLELAVIRTEDSGCGVSPEHIDRIFEPFFTTKQEEGTGMGLATAFGIVANHGGWIDVDSTPGEGSIFTIYLPLCQPTDAAGEPDPPSLPAPPPRGRGTVLLVDDESVVLDTTSEMLREIGYSVLTVSSGAAAVELFRRRGSEIDAVVLDLSMPGMDGRACFMELRGIDAEIPVVLASGFSRDGRVQELLDLGVNEYLQKPYRLNDLASTLRKLVK